MRARIQKWGNSLAVRIPKAVCQQVKLEENSMVEVLIEGEKLVITKVIARLSIEEMVALITPENQHPLELPDDASRDGEFW